MKAQMVLLWGLMATSISAASLPTEDTTLRKNVYKALGQKHRPFQPLNQSVAESESLGTGRYLKAQLRKVMSELVTEIRHGQPIVFDPSWTPEQARQKKTRHYVDIVKTLISRDHPQFLKNYVDELIRKKNDSFSTGDESTKKQLEKIRLNVGGDITRVEIIQNQLSRIYIKGFLNAKVPLSFEMLASAFTGEDEAFLYIQQSIAELLELELQAKGQNALGQTVLEDYRTAFSQHKLKWKQSIDANHALRLLQPKLNIILGDFLEFRKVPSLKFISNELSQSTDRSHHLIWFFSNEFRSTLERFMEYHNYSQSMSKANRSLFRNLQK